MRNLVGKKAKTIKVPFMETETVEVTKLTVSQVKTFQKSLKEADALEDEEKGISIQRSIIRMAVVGADDLTDEELDDFPMDDLNSLVQRILELAGVKAEDSGNDSPQKT